MSLTSRKNLTRLEALAQYYDAQRDRYRNRDGDPKAEKWAGEAADNANAIRWAARLPLLLEELFSAYLDQCAMEPDSALCDKVHAAISIN